MTEDEMLEEHAQGPNGIVVNITVRGDRAELELRGEIDIATVDQLGQSLDGLLGSCAALTVDLAGVTFIDSLGLRALVRAANHFGPDNFVLKSPPRSVRKLVRLAGLQEVLRMDPPEPSSNGH
jgi:anti-anti-sigma factor